MAYWKRRPRPPGLKVEDEEGLQNVLGHRPEVALGEDGEFVGGDHVLGSETKVAGYITAVVALEGLQAHPGFRNIRACEKRGQLRNFAVDMVNIEASGFERGNVETDDIVIVGRAISEWYRAASENSNKACVGSSKKALQIFLGLGGFRAEEGVDDFGMKGG